MTIEEYLLALKDGTENDKSVDSRIEALREEGLLEVSGEAKALAIVLWALESAEALRICAAESAYARVALQVVYESNEEERKYDA